MGFDGVKDLFTKAMLLHQMAEGEDRGLIRDPIADQLDAGKAAYRGNLNQGPFHGRITERIPPQQQVIRSNCFAEAKDDMASG